MKELFKMGGAVGKKTDTMVFAIGFGILMLVWYAVTATEFIPHTILPNPFVVIHSYKELYTDVNAHFTENIWYSVKLNLVGYAYALLISIPLGFIIGMFPIGKSLFNKIFDAFRFIPLPATTGIFIAVFGMAFNMKANFLSFGILIYILPVVIQRVSELQNPSNDKDYVYLQTISTLGATNWQKFIHVYFPYVMRKISDDIRVLTAISWTYITIVEILNMDGGIGAMINVLGRQSRTAEVYALIFLIVFIGIVQDLLFKGLDKLLFPSKHNAKPITATIKKFFVK